MEETKGPVCSAGIQAGKVELSGSEESEKAVEQKEQQRHGQERDSILGK